MTTPMTKNLAVAAAAAIVLASAGRAGAAGDVDVAAIQQAIDAKGAHWKAGETSLTRMSPAERDALIPDVLEVPDLSSIFPEPEAWVPAPPPPVLPDPTAARFSWKDYLGEDWMTEVRDQGACGSCWAFGALAAVEGTYNVAIGNANVDIDLAEQVLVSCADGNCDTGGMAETVVQYLRTTGVPDEQCYPYIAANGNCADRCVDWEARSFTISGWGWVFDLFDQEQAVKERLMSGPVITDMTVYADFMSYTEGVYEHVTGERQGGHVVAIVGWDDEHDSWICKNSWGRAWGDLGYFEIKRGEADLGMHVVYVNVSASLFRGHPCMDPVRQPLEVVSQGPLVSVDVAMTNCGGDVLDWTSAPDPESGWMAVAPASGSLALGDSTTLTATIDPYTMTRLGPWAASVLVRGGISDSRSYLDIEVISVPPVASFEADVTSGPAPLAVHFANTSEGSVNASSWDFGDGDTAITIRDAAHTYEAEGTYSVTLDLSGPAGEDGETRTDYITVLPPAAEPEPEDVPDTATDATGDTAGDVGTPGDGADPGCGCSLVS